MPLTKQYLRYSPKDCCNIIASPNCNGVWTSLKGQDGRFVATGACEDITIWDLQIGEKASVIVGENYEVTVLCSMKKNLAAGFSNGAVKTINVETGETTAVFTGHKSAVTCLSYDCNGHRLASGSKDTHVVVWDVVAENGIARLSSHTGPITQTAFMPQFNILLSSSKDTSVKFWDLDTNHCFKTLLGHRTEVWSFVLMRRGDFLVTGCADSELRVWNLKHQDVKTENAGHLLNDDDEDSLSQIKCVKMGSVLRSSIGRVVGMAENEGDILAVHGASDTLELFSFHSHLQALLRMKKRQKKERKKSGAGVLNDNENEAPVLQDIVKRLPVIKSSGKIKSSQLILGKRTELRVLLILNNNTVEVYGMDTELKNATPRLLRAISNHGHHSEIRALAFSSDNLAFASGAGDSVKLWNRASLICLRTITTGYVISLVFVPGDRHVVAGLKDGTILVIDINIGEIIEEISAHSTEVWSICSSSDSRGCVSGSGDCTVKFWDYDLIGDEKNNKILSLAHKRTLTLEEPVLCVRVTPSGKLVAVALLDMTIKVFFVDTLKFFISLYGHKLPVVTMDVSDDSTLLVSGSADRNIKIWGLDYGDCHKSIFAHDLGISGVQFIPGTHYIFSCGKDGRIKQWDGDSYNNIVTIRGHFGESWVLAVSPNGEHVVTAGSDRVIRVLVKTDEPLVLEDEAEEERARAEEEQLATGPETTVKGQSTLNLPSRKTVGSERGAEQLMECLDSCKSYQNAVDEFERTGRKGQRPGRPVLMDFYQTEDTDEFLIETLKKIRSSDLEETLVLLPFSAVCELLQRFPELFRKKKEVELVTKTLTFLLQIHHGPIISSRELLPVLMSVQKLASESVTNLRDMVGTNFHGLQLIQRDIEQKEGVQLFRDATIEKSVKTKRKKRKEGALKRAILSI